MRRLVLGVAALCLLAGCSGGSTHPVATPRRSSTTPRQTTSAHTQARGLAIALIGHLPFSVSREVAIADGGEWLLLGGLLSGNVTTDHVALVNSGGHLLKQGALAQRTHDAAGVLLNGKVLVFGGGAANTESAVQQYANGSGRVVGQLPSPRSDIVAVAVGGTAYVIGGYDGHTPLADVLATTDGQTFTKVATLIEGVRYPAVAIDGNAIYVIGGEAPGGDTSLIQRVDLSTHAVTAAGRLPSTLAHAMAGVVDGRVVIAGGRRNGVRTSQVLSFDPATGRIAVVGALPLPLTDAGATNINGVLWLFGGESPNPVDTVIRVGAA